MTEELPAPHASDPEETLEAKREAALRAGLADYELSDDDLATLSEDSGLTRFAVKTF